MSDKLFIFPYKMASNSAKRLGISVGGKMIKHEGSVFRGNKDKVVVNWGFGGDLPEEVAKCRVLNPPEKINSVSNKLNFFREVSSSEEPPRVPRWTQNKDEALQWIVEEGRAVFARTVLRGHSGVGIIEVNNPDDLASIKDGTLLVEYIPKKTEYRIHVGLDGEVFDIQRKGAKEGRAEGAGWRIRNVQNGFVFVRNDLGKVPEDVLDQAVKTHKAIGLDFGAVDVVWNERRGQAFVLEVNSSPGLEGTTVVNYSKMFAKHFPDKVVVNEEAGYF